MPHRRTGTGRDLQTPEPADLSLDPALLMSALDAGLAEERLEPVGRAQRDEPFGLVAVAALRLSLRIAQWGPSDQSAIG
jgi:hypothetical protein